MLQPAMCFPEDRRWSAETSVKPVHHVDGLVVWMDLGGTLQAATSEHVLRWRRGGFGPLGPLRLRGWFFDRHLLLIHGGQLECIDLVANETRWRRPSAYLEALDLPEGRLYVETLPEDLDRSEIVGLSLADGSERSRIQRPYGSCKVIWAGGDLLIAVEDACVGPPAPSGVVGIDRTTGQTRWSTVIERPRHLGGTARPWRSSLVWKDLLILALQAYGFVALRRATGELVWDTAIAWGGQSSAIASGGRIRWLTSHDYREISMEDGAVVVERDISAMTYAIGLGADIIGTPVERGPYLFAVGARGIAFTYDTVANRIAWHQPLGARSALACTPSIADDKLWLLDVTGKMHVFDLRA